MRSSPAGHGLVAHKALMAISELAGIADLSADVRGSTAPLNVVRAVFRGLQSQTRITELAAARGKSVLRYADARSIPTVVARNAPHANTLVRHMGGMVVGFFYIKKSELKHSPPRSIQHDSRSRVRTCCPTRWRG